MQLDQILKVAVRGGASDILLKVGAKPKFRFNGALVALSDGHRVSAAMMAAWVTQVSPKAHVGGRDVDFSYKDTTGNRYRVNLFRQQGHDGLVFRVIPRRICSLEELILPSGLADLCQQVRGLVMVTGATGSGKTTTIAAMLELINRTQAKHILTIEDPIEYIFDEKMATINQREVGKDTDGFATALRSSLRQDPDVILVGELRDRETAETALMAAETGHLVFTTVHTMDAIEALYRILSFFPEHRHRYIRLLLSQTLNAVVSQRLIPRSNGQGRVAACEVLLATRRVKEIIAEGERFELAKDAIKEGKNGYGMQSFDDSLFDLLSQGLIDQAEAMRHASNKDDFKLMLKGIA